MDTGDNVVWLAAPNGEVVAVTIPPELDAAYDILRDDDVPTAHIESMLAACIRDGRNPERWARHFVKLRRAVRNSG